jgi:hypothetical protein
MRTKVTPAGPMACSPSAMNKKEAPQMIPGRVTRIQSAAPALAGGSVVALPRSAGVGEETEAAVVEAAIKLQP